MSGTLTLGVQVQDTFGERTRSLYSENINHTCTGNARKGEHIVVTNTGQGETIPMGDVTDPLLMVVRNLDAANDIEWGIDNAGNITVMGRLVPGLVYYIPLYTGITYRVRAVTAPCEMDFDIWSR